MKKFITIHQSDGSVQQLSEENLPLIIGGDDTSHIILPGTKFQTAFIGEEQGHLFIQPSQTSDIPVFHNNRQLINSAWIKSNDILQYQDSIITLHISGDKITLIVSNATSPSKPHSLEPPADLTPDSGAKASELGLPVKIIGENVFSTQKKIVACIVFFTFLLLGLGVFFVLFAQSLRFNVIPEPESVSISGFPPAVKFGPGYLLMPGTYSVNIKKQGFIPFTESLVIDRKDGRKTFTATLEKLPGLLLLETIPPDGIRLFSDNRLLGTTPPYSFEVAPGNHSFRLEKEGYLPHQQDILIEGKHNKQTVKAQLSPDWAQISFNTIPQQATVYADGKYLGETPFTTELTGGKRKIAITKQLYSEHQTTIFVQAEHPQEYSFELELLPGQLSIISTPERAAVTVDNMYLGSTPLTTTLSSNFAHVITLHSPGFKSSSREINLNPEEKKDIHFTLEEERGVIYLVTHPPDASILIDGRQFGNSPEKLVLPVKESKLVVKAPGYKPITRTIHPKLGFSQQITIDLSPETGSAIAYSAQKSKETTVTTAADQKMIRVQPSSFTMGAPRREPGRRANERKRTVIMKRPFYLSEKPVTNSEYRQFKKNHASGTFNSHSLNNDNQPVVNISWEDAAAYLNWLSLQDKLQPFYIAENNSFTPVSPPTNGYRFPTEAEWAFSARNNGGDKNLKFPWGNSFPPWTTSGNFADESAKGILPQVIKGYNDRFPVSSPVGSYPPNSRGFYDMGGNISEWCHDFYSPYTSPHNNKQDPLGPDSGMHRVVRGSSWRDATIKELRLSYRSYSRKKLNTIGFRIARY